MPRLSPGGDAFGARECLEALTARRPVERLRAELQRRSGAHRISLHASGREALRSALVVLAARSGRSEVIVPAYTCFSVPAAAVAAGLQVRLVDVDARGRIDGSALAALPLEKAAAIVVHNLFGVPEPIGPIRALAEAAKAAIVDDAAQAFGACAAEGPVGGRGDVGIVSFGRGKPLSGLGGGAALWCRDDLSEVDEAPAPGPRRILAAARALAWDFARGPAVFGALSAVPGLGIGETRYDPGFRRGGIDGAAATLAAAALGALERASAARRARALELAARLERETRFAALIEDPGDAGCYPRLAVRAPSEEQRDGALLGLWPLGATRMYPSSLDRLAPLEPARAGSGDCPGARALAARLLTLPTHAGLSSERIERIAARLAEAT